MTAQTILPANSVRGGDLVTNSCRFNAPDDAYMHKTPSSDGSRRIGTFSIWVKLALNTSEGQYLFSGSPDATTETSLGLSIDGDDLRFNGWTGNSQHMLLVTDRKFRDPSAWYHIVVAWDTTQGTASNRVKIYVNGVQETSFSTETYPDQNRDLNINNASNKTLIGARSTANYAFADGYYSEVVMIDGTALTPTSFGEFDSDTPTVWKPIDVSGLTFGTNGFYLDFEDSSNLGNDKSGGTDLTESNLAATDQSTDTCVNNFATMNPLTQSEPGNSPTFAENNLKITMANFDTESVMATMGVKKGKWYWEVKGGWKTSNWGFGIEKASSSNVGFSVGYTTTSYSFSQNGYKQNASSASQIDSGLSDGDIIGYALDLDNGHFNFSQNGVWYNGSATESTTFNTSTHDFTSLDFGSEFVMPTISGFGDSAITTEINFGNPSFAISSGNADANDHGNFEYEVPSGYFALCTKNIAEYGG